jgi:uncharacterized protein
LVAFGKNGRYFYEFYRNVNVNVGKGVCILNKKIRIIYFTISIIFLESSFFIITNEFVPQGNHIVWYQAGFLSLCIGMLFSEPFYTKPVDALITSVALFFTMINLNEAPYIMIWRLLIVLCTLIFLMCIYLLWFEEKDYVQSPRLAKINKSLLIIVKELGSAKVLSSAVYITGVISFVKPSNQGILFIGWLILLILIYFKPEKSFNTLLRIWNNSEEKISYCGTVAKFEEPNIVQLNMLNEVEEGDIIGISDSQIFNRQNVIYGIIYKKFNGAGQKITNCIILDNQINDWKGQKYAFKLKNFNNLVCIDDSVIFKRQSELVGVIIEGSDIENIKVKVINSSLINNNDIIEVESKGVQILYQINNALTSKDEMTVNKMGYEIVTAKQVGSWNPEKSMFEPHTWVPSLNSVVYKVNRYTEQSTQIPSELSQIGTFDTGHPIYVNINDLVTHNTAILGVTGSGKSSMGYTIIEQIIEKNIKCICIDNSGDYLRSVNYDNIFEITKSEHIEEFLNSESLFAVANATLVSNALAIIRSSYEWAKGKTDTTKKEIEPKICVFIEEAHALIPEWNSVVNRDDQQLVNRISQYVMQGRKYGSGVIVVTQRTANVTKSILSQCNTIMSFKAFDKTSNDFLSSFMDEGYINSIGMLQTGHGIIAGKALTSGKPVVFKSVTRFSDDDESIYDEVAATRE